MRMPCGHGQTVDAPCIGEVRAEDAKRWWALGVGASRAPERASTERRGAPRDSKKQENGLRYVLMVREGERKIPRL